MSSTITTRTRLVDDLFTTTWDDVGRSVIDQVFQITPLWSLLVEKGRIRRRMPDGSYFEIPISYDKLNQNTKWFGRGDSFGRAEKQSLTRLQYAAKNLGTSVVRFWDDDRKNRGRAKLIDYVNNKIENTKASLVDQLETDAFVQNSDSNSMNSLSTLISTTPTTGTVAGLDRSTQDWMDNQTQNFSGKDADTELRGVMTTIYNDCSKWKAGMRRTPDVIMTTQTIYEKIEDILTALQMIVASNSPQASLGFGDLLFKKVPIYWSPSCESGKMYFINTEHLFLDIDPAVDFEMTEWKSDPDTLDRVAQVVAVCQLGVDNFRKHGVIYNITA